MVRSTLVAPERVGGLARRRTRSPAGRSLAGDLKRNYDLYILAIPAVLYFGLFHYWPMYGVIIAFKRFNVTQGILGSPWVGLRYFNQFFGSHHFWQILWNTVGIRLYELALGFPFPIILALMMNELRNARIRKFVQTATYAPHFISTVVMVAMITLFLSPRAGVVNVAIQALGLQPVAFMQSPEWFKSVYVLSGIWQNSGFASIIYLAALSTVDPQLHEAAIIDGASRFQRVFHINIPSILPTMIILLILNTGRIMTVGFEKVFLMQNPLNLSASQVISTYVYQRGLLDAQFSFATAVGLFNSVINLAFLIGVNRIAKVTTRESLW